MQTILGSGGAIGIELAKALNEYSTDLRLVSRNPKKVNDSSIVYVTVGFPYAYKTWKQSWPVFIKNVIDACMEFKSKLVFFDNIYMYDLNHLDGMTEDTLIKPPSKKGVIRAEIADMIMDKVKEGKLTALIARSADFYGPGIKNTSVLTETVFNPLSKGKKANWMSSVNFKHSYTYTPDAGKATALLGNSEKAYNQVWHLPTAENPLTGREWIDTIASEMGILPKYQVATKFIVNLLGLFNPIMREMPEMMYQYDRDYIFNSDKFTNQFAFEVTPYREGIREIINSDYKK